MTVDVVKEFAGHLKAFQSANEKRLKWMETFSTKLEKLSQDYDDASKDLQREQLAGRLTQRDAENWKRQFEDLQRSVFKDEYYSHADGGRKAALDLRSSVQDYLQKEKPELSTLPIIVKACANADGLSQLLVKSKIIKSPGLLWDFAKGFSQACDTFDFVLVGSGKDRADEKIKGVFEQFIKNPTCRHVIFGACHDNGYVRLLEKFAEDVVIAERVTLLHSFETGREFGSLKFQSTKMEAVFRNKHIAVRETSPELEVVHPTTGLTWAARFDAARDTNRVTVYPKIKDIPPGVVLVNAAGQRVDAELPQPSQQAVNSWYHKIKRANMRYCRMYHLNGGCKGPCKYSHGPLSEEEKLVYRKDLRLERCHVGVQCHDAKCFYGHNCSCQKQSCNFSPEMHNVDVTQVTTLPG